MPVPSGGAAAGRPDPGLALLLRSLDGGGRLVPDVPFLQEQKSHLR